MLLALGPFLRRRSRFLCFGVKWFVVVGGGEAVMVSYRFLGERTATNKKKSEHKGSNERELTERCR